MNRTELKKYVKKLSKEQLKTLQRQYDLHQMALHKRLSPVAILIGTSDSVLSYFVRYVIDNLGQLEFQKLIREPKSLLYAENKSKYFDPNAKKLLKWEDKPKEYIIFKSK